MACASAPLQGKPALKSHFSRSNVKHPLILLVATLLGACDVVSTTYDDVADAMEHNMIAGGWLPNIIPPSSVDITTNNDLDLNVSWGDFRFSPADFHEFERRLHDPVEEAPFENWEETIRGEAAQGFCIQEYKRDRSVWVLFCKPEKGY